MKTPMQELIDEMQKSPLMFASALTLIEDTRMLEKEKEVIENAYESGQESEWCEYMGLMGDWYYNETFNTEECHHKGKYTYNKETFECHKCGLIVPNEYRFNSKEK